MSLDNIVLFNLLFAGLFGLMLWSMPVRQTWARVAAVVLFVFVSLKYASWRVGSLPDLHFSFGSLWPWGFFLFELITLVYELWIFIVMTRLSDHSHEADSYEARLRTCSSLPTVDVFIATYNEELALLRHTILAAQDLDYPRHLVRVLVNDDGGRPELKSLTDELLGEGHYFARPDFVDAKGEKVLDGDGKPAKEGGAGKGGNDRHAFKNSGGDYILLLDADFRLKPEFLYRTLGFLLWRADIGAPQQESKGAIKKLRLQTEVRIQQENIVAPRILESVTVVSALSSPPLLSRLAIPVKYLLALCVNEVRPSEVVALPQQFVSQGLQLWTPPIIINKHAH